MRAVEVIAVGALIASCEVSAADSEGSLPLKKIEGRLRREAPAQSRTSGAQIVPGIREQEILIAASTKEGIRLDEVRRQIRACIASEIKCAAVAARQELAQSVDEARSRALEQARKLAEEAKEIARSKGCKAEM